MTPQEFERCLSDRMWRLNNLYYVKDKNGKTVQFKLNRSQLHLIKHIWYRNIILKARQLGMTTAVMIYFLDAALFGSNTNCGVIAHGLSEAQKLFGEKIKFAYDNLPDEIKELIPLVGDSKQELKFANGSSFWVSTSFRSGTLQYLHISEFGKICAKYPDRAEEIVSGAFEAVPKDGCLTIESTAEGRAGYFFDYCQRAEHKALASSKLSTLDFKFFFFPWYEDPEYTIDPDGVVIPERLNEYFYDLQVKEGVLLTNGQRAWYSIKEAEKGDLMKREYPATSAEAFQQSIEGAYYAKEFTFLYANKRIGPVPYQKQFPVFTWWDIGYGDDTAIWFIQKIGLNYHAIDYYEMSGEGVAHFAQVIREKGYWYSAHIGPHDLDQHEKASGLTYKQVAAKVGLNFQVVPIASIESGINAVRQVLPMFYFDEAKCEKGIEKLQRYRRAWNERHGCFHDYPLHDDASHCADAFRIGATSTEIVVAEKPRAKTVQAANIRW